MSRSFGRRDIVTHRLQCGVDQIRDGLRRVVPFEVSRLDQPEGRSQVTFQLMHGGRSHDICIDFVDPNRIDLDFAKSFSVYFKMQYVKGGYGLEQVIPGGYVLRWVSDYLRLGKLRQMADQQEYEFGVHGRLGVDVNRENNGIRVKGLGMLKEAGYPSFSGELQRVSRKKYMEEITHSKVCIDLFGHGFLCHRLVEYLSIGACVVAPHNPNRLIEPLLDRKHIAYVKPDLSDLIDVCEYYLSHEAERLAMVQESRAYFDAYLHRDRLVEHYLREMLDRTD